MGNWSNQDSKRSYFVFNSGRGSCGMTWQCKFHPPLLLTHGLRSLCSRNSVHTTLSEVWCDRTINSHQLQAEISRALPWHSGEHIISAAYTRLQTIKNNNIIILPPQFIWLYMHVAIMNIILVLVKYSFMHDCKIPKSHVQNLVHFVNRNLPDMVPFRNKSTKSTRIGRE